MARVTFLATHIILRDRERNESRDATYKLTDICFCLFPFLSYLVNSFVFSSFILLLSTFAAFSMILCFTLPS